MSELDDLAELVLMKWTKDKPAGAVDATTPTGERSTGIWWADRMKELLTKISGGRRYSANKKLMVRAPKIEMKEDEENKPWAGIIIGGSENEKTGKYRGDSFVIFPSLKGGSVLTLALGSLGPGDDVEYLSRPELARNVNAIADYINIDVCAGNSCAWSKPTPARTDINELPVPSECINTLRDSALDFVLTAYQNVIYLAVDISHGLKLSATNAPDQASVSATRRVLELILDQFLLHHGSTLRAGASKDDTYKKYIFPRQDETTVFERIKDRRYVILEGPPGTGKTRLCRRLQAIGTNGTVIKDDETGEKFYKECWNIQFHPNTTYEQFVGGLYPKPNPAGGAMFEPKEGMLLKAIATARDNPGEHYLLQIDEINRADLSRVLGEAISLFEPRADYENPIDLPFKFPSFPDAKIASMPSNLHVIGTMNSADRSIAILDIAIRRRFSFYQLYPQPDVVEANGSAISKQAFKELKDIFTTYASDDAFKYMPGHSYFIGCDGDAAKSKLQIRYELIPLLQEYLAQGYVSGFEGQIRAYIQEWNGKCGAK